MIRAPRYATAVTLAIISGLHLAWGLGSPFPFATRDDLADAVVGTRNVPPPSACFGVAGALALASGLVAGAPVLPRRLRRPGVAIVATVLATRSAAGFRGRTDLLSPGSNSPRFRRLDRSVYSPLCLALALGSVSALRD